MALSGKKPAQHTQDAPQRSLLQRIASKSRLIASTGIATVLLSMGPGFAKASNGGVTLKDAKAKATMDVLKSTLNVSTISFDAAANRELQYEEMIRDPQINAALENKAYETYREKLKPIKIKDAVVIGSPLGNDFDDLTQRSKVGSRNLWQFDGDALSWHDGLDFGQVPVGEPVKAVETSIVKSSDITNRGNVGYIDLSSLDGKRLWHYGHTYTRSEIENLQVKPSLKKKAAALINPDTDQPYQVGDTVRIGNAFTLVAPRRPGERSTHQHLHLSLYKPGVFKANGKPQEVVGPMNSLLKKNGVLYDAVVDDSEKTKQLGWYAAEGLLKGKTVEELKAENIRNNMRAFGADTSPEGIIRFAIDQLESRYERVKTKNGKTKLQQVGYNPADGGTMWGITRNSHKSELKAFGIHSNKGMKNLSKDQAISIYIPSYWDKLNLDAYEGNPEFQLAAFNLGIQRGTNGAAPMIAQAKGDAKALVKAHKNFLARNHVPDRINRMKKQDLHLAKMDKTPEMMGPYKFRDNKLAIAAKEIESQKKQEFAVVQNEIDRKTEAVLNNPNLLAQQKKKAAQQETEADRFVSRTIATDRGNYRYSYVSAASIGGKNPEPEITVASVHLHDDHASANKVQQADQSRGLALAPVGMETSQRVMGENFAQTKAQVLDQQQAQPTKPIQKTSFSNYTYVSSNSANVKINPKVVHFEEAKRDIQRNKAFNAPTSGFVPNATTSSAGGNLTWSYSFV